MIDWLIDLYIVLVAFRFRTLLNNLEPQNLLIMKYIQVITSWFINNVNHEYKSLHDELIGLAIINFLSLGDENV